ncbi:PEP-CTERM sorting domain-containing protein [Pseudoduganella sp. FT55W]|uniref:PEP-CTERM sorting domain-containing protein n=1 Tax=Duganella rivi TaxID=2666083 RepID=A0A7X4GV56_9BURK|nr:PEP-CTERM sorting domain-containing protein [Duganella rivi]MYM70260.1 PEP-CTERM sorting domain-containing protein [Duganella rivi]
MKAFVRKTMQAAVLATTMLGAAAFAAPPPGHGPADPPDCSIAFNGDLKAVVVSDCSGFVEHNQIKGSADATAAGMLADLGVLSDGHFLAAASVSGTTLTFSQALYGVTVIGLHIGGGSDGNVKESSAFFKFDAGTTGIHSVDTRFTSLSNGGLYLTSAVPEPETYGMLLAGIGLIGVLARRRRKA